MSTYAEVAPGEFAVIEDAWGWITVIRFEANAAAELGVRPGDPVWLLARRRLTLSRRWRRSATVEAEQARARRVEQRQLSHRRSRTTDPAHRVEERRVSCAMTYVFARHLRRGERRERQLSLRSACTTAEPLHPAEPDTVLSVENTRVTSVPVQITLDTASPEAMLESVHVVPRAAGLRV